MTAMLHVDSLKRPMRDLRISVTDRCNFRCTYCMPFDEYTWIERQQVLSFEEIDRLVRLFLPFGIQKVRLTGGEPLVRKDLHRLISRLSNIPDLKDLSVTTHGPLVAGQAPCTQTGFPSHQRQPSIHFQSIASGASQTRQR